MQSPATTPAAALPQEQAVSTVSGPPNLAAETACFHCGTPCGGAALASHDRKFCCQGCLMVYELLTENGLTEFYQLADNAGVRVRNRPGDEWRYLDEPSVRRQVVDFADARITRATFRLPAIHCVACVWLLENLFRLNGGIGRSQVNFARKELSVTFEDGRIKLSEVVALLASLGYEPDLKFSDLEKAPASPAARRLWLQLGVAGFAFGNIMLFSISSYLGLDAANGAAFRTLFGWASFALALPVFFYSAGDYWRSAWASLRTRRLTIDVPIAAGIVALFGQSAYEIVTRTGEGYFDSLAGLLFFLLCGKWFQQKTYDRLAFDRDYKTFFPLAVTRKQGREEARVALSQLAIGDRLMLRNGELLPADACLVSGPALVDYSFVTGESEPVEKAPGDYLYAGGRQMGGAIEVELVKAVSQSYLASLWGQDAFRKERRDTLDTLTNRYSQRFTRIVLAIAIGAALYWWWVNPALAVRAFVSVLIVACPCALALAAPFALGTAQRMLARRQVYLKNPQVIETLARVDTVVFDKTGTLTGAGADGVTFHGALLREEEERWLYSMTQHSTHPSAVRIGEALSARCVPETVRSFLETPGCGMEGSVAGREIWMGSAAWLASRGAAPEADGLASSAVHVAVNGRYRGAFVLAHALRAGVGELIARLAPDYQLALLSGDNERERARFAEVFGSDVQLHFNQSPLDKLARVRQLQQEGRCVLMAGDGLNDAGALKQADAGVAVVENIGAFSPASDVIAAADAVPQLDGILDFSRATVRVVRLSFLISSVYNVVGIAIAASGRLSPIVCAVLMPLSSITVVAFACGMTAWLGRKGAVRP